MGFLKHLLFWPVTGPAFLTEFALGRVQGVVREQLTDDARVKEALLDLQLRMELDEVDDEEYMEEEARLMAELREVRRWREEFGMATRGGVVQVGDADEPTGPADDAEPGASTLPADAAAEDSEDEAPPVVPRGATLEVTLDWDDDDEAESEWDQSSTDGSGPASSSS